MNENDKLVRSIFKLKNVIDNYYNELMQHMGIRIQYYQDTNNKESMGYYNNLDDLHNTDGPALITWYPNGSIKSYNYFINGINTNTKGPSVIVYYEDGNIKLEIYKHNGFIHNSNGPAVIDYYNSGKIKREQYAEYGKSHRYVEPADIYYDEDGNITKEIFVVNGVVKKIENK